MSTTISTLVQQITRVFTLTKTDPKPLYGIMNHLTSEVGELAEAVEVQEGHSKKVLKEPLVGEVVDVIQCALSVLARATKDMSDNDRLYLLTKHFSMKNDKWEAAQSGVPAPVHRVGNVDLPSTQKVSGDTWVHFDAWYEQNGGQTDAIVASASQTGGDTPETELHRRIFRVVCEQLGLSESTLKYDSRFIADLGCDSLDTVELIMALEDELGVELNTHDEENAEKIVTVRDACLFAEALQHRKTAWPVPPAPAPALPSPVALQPRQTLASALAGTGVVPQGGFKNSELTVLAAASSSGKTLLYAPAETGRVYVQIRKHPSGLPQPTGKRRVTRMELKDGLLFVGIGDGKQGWKIDLSKPDPSFLTFRLGLEGGPQANAASAWEYHKRHNP